MKISKEIRLLLKPYYYINILLSASYIVAKKLPFFCHHAFPSSESQCEFDSEEELRLTPRGPVFSFVTTALMVGYFWNHHFDLVVPYTQVGSDCIQTGISPGWQSISNKYAKTQEQVREGSFIFGALFQRESEILFFLMIVVMIRTRKAGSVTMINYLSSSFMYTKVANLILWFYADIRMGIFFGIILILVGLLLPEPAYKGPENVVYFRTAQGVEDEISRNKKVCWLITFYTAWNPACVNFAPVFSQLSVEYHLENLNFGKIDIGRYPDAGKKYYVNDSPMSRQLPTVILFKEGKEVMRRPMVDTKGKLQKFFFSEDNVKAEFDLNNLYNECKANPLKKKKELTDHQKSE